MDVAGIEPGRDFRKAIDQSVATCSLLLAMIGPEWLEWKDALGHRRLEDANDFVRIELASALRRDIPVVPVLVRGARMPRVEQLPDDLKELAYRNAVELTHARWKSDVQVLIQALRSHLDTPGQERSGQERSGQGRSAAHSAPVEKEIAGRGEQDSGGTPTDRSAETAPTVSSFEPQTIERVSKELAAYIGPIAEVVVKRAAKRSSSVKDLYEVVAREIKTEAERSNFLRLRRS